MTLQSYSIACAVLVSALLSLSVGSSAQMTDGNALPQALKNLKPATGKCLRDDVGIYSGSAVDGEVSPDLSCMASVTDALGLVDKSGTVVADLRPPSDFSAFHIDGAINLTVAELHAKPYWREKSVVLVGNGKAEVELYRECGRLKQMGYRRLRVLQGGMPSWLSQRLPISGRAPAAAQLVRLSATELWGESRNGLGLVLLDPAHAALQNDLPGSQVLHQLSASELQAAISRSKRRKKSFPFTAVIAVAQPGLTDDQIREFQQAVAPVPLLVYSDTRDAYARAIGSQKAIWKAQARGPKRPGCGL
jgi:rhodanese-related sulfurtransferase